MKNIILDFISLSKKFGLKTAIKLLSIKTRKKQSIKRLVLNWNAKNIDLFFRTNTTDYTVFRQIFIKKDYDLALPFKPQFILDAGANNGFSSLFFNCKFPDSRIIAVEPDENNYTILVQNINKIGNITPIKAALWSEEGNLNIIETDKYNKDAIMVKKMGSGIDKIVKAISINRILYEHNMPYFDLIKMDVEGSEKEVFSKNLEWLPKTRVIIIELHDWIASNCSFNFFKMLIKNDWGFSVLLKGENIICFRDHDDYMKTLKK